jgi:hypothetical protein
LRRKPRGRIRVLAGEQHVDRREAYGWGWRVASDTAEVIACRYTAAATSPSIPTVRFDLVYDATTTSQASRSALVFGLGAFVIGVVWAAWLRSRDQPVHVGAKFVLGVSVLMIALSGLYVYEQRRIAARTDVRTVEGPVVGHWTRRERRTGSNNSYWHQEGFYVGGVSFAYTRNVEQNYFHNGGASAFDIVDGTQLRIRYVEERDGETVRNNIVRVERRAE